QRRADVDKVARRELRRAEPVDEDRNALHECLGDVGSLDGDRHDKPAGPYVLGDHRPCLRVRHHERLEQTFAVLGIPPQIRDAQPETKAVHQRPPTVKPARRSSATALASARRSLGVPWSVTMSIPFGAKIWYPLLIALIVPPCASTERRSSLNS